MNQKRTLLVILILLLGILLVACGGPEATAVPAAVPATSVPDPTSEPEEVEPEEAMEEVTETIKIAMVMPSATTDLAWSQSIYDAVVNVQSMHPDGAIEIEFTEGMFNVTDAAAALRDYADGGAHIVIAHGTQYGTSLFELAPDYPETAFVFGTSRNMGEAEGLDNIFAYDAQADEGGFINGVIAAHLSESGTIGIVGPVEAGDAKLYIDGFANGAVAANPDVNVQIAYTGSFGDTALAAEVANTHIASGADVLTGSAQQVVGAIGVAAENGVPWLGTQSDQSPIAPEIVVATQKYDWTSMVSDLISNVQKGVYGGTLYELTLANGGLTMVYGDLPADVVAAADAAVAGIISGDIDPTVAMMPAMADGGGDMETPEIGSVKIAMVMPSAITDLAWSQSIYDAVVNVQGMFDEGVVEIEFTEGMFNVTDAAAALRDYADGGADIVIAHGTQYGTSLFELAPDYPETAFVFGTSRNIGSDEGLENIYAYDAQADEGGFINGVIAAALSESGTIGIVGPVEAGDAKLYIDGFANGAMSMNPDANVQIAYTGSFGDTALAAEVANTHIASGADVLTGSAQQVVGAIGVAAENGVPWLGTQSDQSPIAPEVVVATQKYDWTAMVLDIIGRTSNGEYGGTVYELTLENGGLTMVYNDNLPDDVVAAADAAVAGIISGDIDPTQVNDMGMGEMAEESMMAAPDIDPVKIAMVMPSATTDLAWSQSIYDAVVVIQSMYDDGTVEIEFTEGMFNVTDAAAALRDYADGGADIVIAHGTQYGTSLFELAPDYPDTAFVFGTSRNMGADEGLENIFAYDAQADEGGYINGVIAAMLSESGTIGIVGPVEAGDAKLYIDGFTAGAMATNPDGNVQIAYTGSFGDTALAAEVANTHIASGADVLTGSAQQVVGSIGVAAENGIPWLGTQSDQSPIAPEVVVATQKYDWTAMVMDIIVKAQAGEVGGTVYELTLENGGLTMVYGDLPADVVAAADAAVSGIISGDIDPSGQ